MDIRAYYDDPNERPLDRIKPDGGLTGIFRTITVVGDSLAAGEQEGTKPDGGTDYHDLYDYSWGQYIARATGSQVRVFSRGGMTAKEYLETWADENGLWDPEKASQAYILALGVNDVLNQKQTPGSADDIDLAHPENNRPTFAGYYAGIIQRYKAIQPKARFFLMTCPRYTLVPDGQDKEILKGEHAKTVREVAGLFEFTYVIDLYQYGPVYDEKFRSRFFLGGHMNAAGYLLTAQMTMSYIDWIIRNNPDDFVQTGFIGTPWHNEEFVW